MKKLLLVFLLTGCASQSEIQAQKEQRIYQAIVTYGPKCEAAGFRRKSQEWEKCIVALYKADADADQRERIGNAYRDVGRSFTSDGTTTCRRDSFGAVTCRPGY